MSFHFVLFLKQVSLAACFSLPSAGFIGGFTTFGSLASIEFISLSRSFLGIDIYQTDQHGGGQNGLFPTSGSIHGLHLFLDCLARILLHSLISTHFDVPRRQITSG